MHRATGVASAQGDGNPTEIRPILPCYREAFARLTSWVTSGATPPANQTVARPVTGDVANTCPALAAAPPDAGPEKGKKDKGTPGEGPGTGK